VKTFSHGLTPMHRTWIRVLLVERVKLYPLSRCGLFTFSLSLMEETLKTTGFFYLGIVSLKQWALTRATQNPLLNSRQIMDFFMWKLANMDSISVTVASVSVAHPGGNCSQQTKPLLLSKIILSGQTHADGLTRTFVRWPGRQTSYMCAALGAEYDLHTLLIWTIQLYDASLHPHSCSKLLMTK